MEGKPWLTEWMDDARILKIAAPENEKNVNIKIPKSNLVPTNAGVKRKNIVFFPVQN